MYCSLSPDEQRNLVNNTFDLMNRSASAGATYAELDRREREYLDGTSVKNCSTKEELDQLDSLYKAYMNAYNEYMRYKQYLVDKAYTAGLTSTSGLMYTL